MKKYIILYIKFYNLNNINQMRFYFSIIFIISLILIIFITELYLKSIGLGDPIRYDTNYIYGYAPKLIKKNKD